MVRGTVGVALMSWFSSSMEFRKNSMLVSFMFHTSDDDVLSFSWFLELEDERSCAWFYGAEVLCVC